MSTSGKNSELGFRTSPLGSALHKLGLVLLTGNGNHIMCGTKHTPFSKQAQALDPWGPWVHATQTNMEYDWALLRPTYSLTEFCHPSSLYLSIYHISVVWVFQHNDKGCGFVIGRYVFALRTSHLFCSRVEMTPYRH